MKAVIRVLLLVSIVGVWIGIKSFDVAWPEQGARDSVQALNGGDAAAECGARFRAVSGTRCRGVCGTPQASFSCHRNSSPSSPAGGQVGSGHGSP